MRKELKADHVALPYEILLQHVSIVPCLCVFGISHFGLYYLYSSTSRIKVCIREFREFIIVMPNLNYDIPQDFEENEIRSEFARTRMQIISIQIKK